MNHVSTQLPYALFVAGLSFLGYVLAGFVRSAFVVLPVSFVLLVGILLLIWRHQKKKRVAA